MRSRGQVISLSVCRCRHLKTAWLRVVDATVSWINVKNQEKLSYICLLTQDNGYDRYKSLVCGRHAYKPLLLKASGSSINYPEKAYPEGIDKEWQVPPRWDPREVSFSLWDTPVTIQHVATLHLHWWDRIAQRYAYLYKQERKASRHYSRRAKRQPGERLRTATTSMTHKYPCSTRNSACSISRPGTLKSFFLSYQGRAGLCLSLFRPQPII